MDDIYIYNIYIYMFFNRPPTRSVALTPGRNCKHFLDGPWRYEYTPWHFLGIWLDRVYCTSTSSYEDWFFESMKIYIKICQSNYTFQVHLYHFYHLYRSIDTLLILLPFALEGSLETPLSSPSDLKAKTQRPRHFRSCLFLSSSNQRQPITSFKQEKRIHPQSLT